MTPIYNLVDRFDSLAVAKKQEANRKEKDIADYLGRIFPNNVTKTIMQQAELTASDFLKNQRFGPVHPHVQDITRAAKDDIPAIIIDSIFYTIQAVAKPLILSVIDWRVSAYINNRLSIFTRLPFPCDVSKLILKKAVPDLDKEIINAR